MNRQLTSHELSQWLVRRLTTKLLCMIRSRSLLSVLGVFLFFVSSPLSAQVASSTGTSVPNARRTLEEAVAAIQSKEPRTGSSFRLIREVSSSASMRESDVGDGIFMDLMRTGGFVILEVNDKSDRAISLHLVSRKRNGDALVESNRVEGEVSASLAQELFSETTEFVEMLFSTPIDASALENKFEGNRFPESRDPDDDETGNLFAVPVGIEKLGADPGEIKELAALLGAVDTWPIRYALSTPTFSANPPRAIETGARKLVSLSGQFTRRQNGKLDVLHLLQDLKSVRSPEQLRNQISELRLLDNSLEKELMSEGMAMTFVANRSIATIPLKIGFYGRPDNSYGVMTASGILVGWKISGNGAPAVARMGLAGD